MEQPPGPSHLLHHHPCYSPNCQAPRSPTSDSDGLLYIPQGKRCLCAGDASTGIGSAGVPGRGSPYHLEGFHLPDHPQQYADPVQRDFVDPPVSWTSLPPPRWSFTPPLLLSPDSSPQSGVLLAPQVPAAANMYTTIGGPYSSTANTVSPVPVSLEQGPTGALTIVQTDYNPSQPFPATSLSDPCAYQEFSLSSALGSNFSTLSDPNEVAFPGVGFGQKISFRMRLVDCPPYDRQVAVSCAWKFRTRAALANLMAKEIKRLIDRERDNRRPLIIMHLRRALTLDDLCLIAIRHVSRASIQPVIGLVASL